MEHYQSSKPGDLVHAIEMILYLVIIMIGTVVMFTLGSVLVLVLHGLRSISRAFKPG